MAKTAEETPTRFEFASLPPVAELEDAKTRQRVVALLELLDATVAERAALEVREEECKAELEALQTAAKTTGFKYGLLCFVAQPVKGRKSLDRFLLMENGVSAKTIQASYKEGAPSVRRTFKRLGEEE